MKTAICLVLAFAPCIGFMCGCHSYRIDATIENRTGGPITILEVDYPSASFGTGSLAADGTFRYRFQTRENGPVTVQYTAADGRLTKSVGPTLYEKQEGQIEIVLLPSGKTEFHPALNPQH